MAIVFEVHVNGKRIAAAGEESLSVLSTIVTAVGKLGRESQGTWRRRKGPADIHLRVSGMTARNSGRHDAHLQWGPPQALKPGDEVRIVVTESNTYEVASEQTPIEVTPENRLSARRRYQDARALYLRLRPRYGAIVDRHVTQQRHRLMFRRTV